MLIHFIFFGGTNLRDALVRTGPLKSFGPRLAVRSKTGDRTDLDRGSAQSGETFPVSNSHVKAYWPSKRFVPFPRYSLRRSAPTKLGKWSKNDPVYRRYCHEKQPGSPKPLLRKKSSQLTKWVPTDSTNHLRSIDLI